jgi:hypothetical protein
MSRNTPIPYFPVPPAQYERQYFAELTRSFSTYAQQMNTPGPWRAGTGAVGSVTVVTP